MPLRKTMWESRRALKDELASAKPDNARIAQLTDELAGTRSQMQSIHAQRQAELKSELTPQQYAQLLVSRHGRGMHRHGRGMRGGETPSQE
jgi:Spy/CpxP family protein refolding chaperone